MAVTELFHIDLSIFSLLLIKLHCFTVKECSEADFNTTRNAIERSFTALYCFRYEENATTPEGFLTAHFQLNSVSGNDLTRDGLKNNLVSYLVDYDGTGTLRNEINSLS
mgnify:CR=1 FL=1